MAQLTIGGSVGLNGSNNGLDVKLAQALVNVYLRSRQVRPALPIIAKSDDDLVDCIKLFQANVLGFSKPDGLIESRGQTFRGLVRHLRSCYTIKQAGTPSKGRLTWDVEGTEGGRFHSRVLHVPDNNSGLTIGRGYDMKHRSPGQITKELTAAKVSSDFAERVAKAAGLYGKTAREFIFDNDLLDYEISPDSQLALFEKVYEHYENEVIRISKAPYNVRRYGEVDWENLDQKIKDVVVDLIYRGDYTVQSRKFLQKHIANNDLAAFGKEISKATNWPAVPPARFEVRKLYVQADVGTSALQACLLRTYQPWAEYA